MLCMGLDPRAPNLGSGSWCCKARVFSTPRLQPLRGVFLYAPNPVGTPMFALLSRTGLEIPAGSPFPFPLGTGLPAFITI